MKSRPVEAEVPPGSRVAALLAGASFHDAWRITSGDADLCALGHFIAAARRTPSWVDACMTARNRAGRLVGLKDLGTLSDVAADKPASAYRPGERVGIFTVFENTFDEALVGDRDKHLDVVLGIHRKPSMQGGGRQAVVTVTTVVHVKNMLGRLYMLPVRPMHRLIAPAVLSAIGHGARAGAA